MLGGGGVCFWSRPISVGWGRGSKRSAPLLPGHQGEPAHGLHPRFVVAKIWADRAPGGGGGGVRQGNEPPTKLGWVRVRVRVWDDAWRSRAPGPHAHGNAARQAADSL